MPTFPAATRSDILHGVLVALLVVVIGLVMLTKAADAFVGGAARLSHALNVPAVIIGAVVVGFGTSAPEMVVSGIASTQGKLDIGVGNIVGSNVANLTLVLGVASLITAMHVESTVIKREAPLSVASVILFAVLVQDGLERWEGAVLLVCLVAALAFLFFGSREGSDELVSEVDEFLHEHDELSVGREALLTLVGLIGVMVGAQATVWGASQIAEDLGLGEGFIALTLVALGTSLPELVTAIAAARKKEDELIVGNLLGSNLFNSLAVGATAGLLGPGPLEDEKLAGLGSMIMVGVAVAAWLFMITGRRVTRNEAIALLVTYVVAVPLLA